MKKRIGMQTISMILTLSILLTCIPTMTLSATEPPVPPVDYDAYAPSSTPLPTPIADAYEAYDPDAEPLETPIADAYEPTAQPAGPYDVVVNGNVTITTATTYSGQNVLYTGDITVAANVTLNNGSSMTVLGELLVCEGTFSITDRKSVV